MDNSWITKIMFYIERVNYSLHGKGLKNMWCRLGNHRNETWYCTGNPEATEPDYHCKDCGELLQ